MQSTNGALAMAVLVVGLVVRQQLCARPVRPFGSLITPAVVGVLGVSGIAFGAVSVVKDRPLTAMPVVLLVATGRRGGLRRGQGVDRTSLASSSG